MGSHLNEWELRGALYLSRQNLGKRGEPQQFLTARVERGARQLQQPRQNTIYATLGALDATCPALLLGLLMDSKPSLRLFPNRLRFAFRAKVTRLRGIYECFSLSMSRVGFPDLEKGA